MTFLCSLLLAISSSVGMPQPDITTPDPVLIDVRPDTISVQQIVLETPEIKTRKFIPCIYDLPYSWTRSVPNKGRLLANTGVLFGGGITMLGILQVLPEDATAWNKSEIAHTNPFKRWWNHVKAGPTWDKDKSIFNQVLHPYAGAAYYMSARSQGYNVWQSWAYSAFISTIFWEYGIEAFNEIPSTQDLIITPLGGMILGETFYILKRHIVSHDYYLLGSRPLGYVVAFIADPLNEALGYIRGNRAHGSASRRDLSTNEMSMSFSPMLAASPTGGFTKGITVSITM